ncbi:TPA: DUF551 domain-containing protein [Klebsiella quasipneumoniae subsp. similipneumoniae]
MTSKFSIDNRELLQRISSGEAVVGIDFGNLIVRELAAFRLVAMGSEPVAIIDQANLDYLRSGADADVWPPEREEMGDVLLYRHAQPAPVSYSDFEEFWSAYIHPLAQDDELKDFSWGIWNACVSNSQPAPVVPELRVDWQENEFSAGWNACRAAMLAAAPHDTPALNSVQSVVTVPGKWIPVSERMPEDRTQVILWDAEIGEVTSGHYSHKTQTFYHCGDAIENEITHWMPPPCAPQEVKSE